MTEMVCITCPTGCQLRVAVSGDEITVAGNECKRGQAFAIAELTNPVRTLCSTVRTAFAQAPMLPVRTDRDIPKEKMHDVMRLIAGVVVEQPIACGEVICGLAPVCEGNLIATSNLLLNLN